MSTARSGLLASGARLNAAASNVANAGVTGPLLSTRLPQPAASEGSPRVYQPVDVILRSIGDGGASTGVAAGYRPRLPADVRRYDPSAPFADLDGLVAAPDVDLAAEAVSLMEAALSFKANLAVLRAADEMTRAFST